MIKINRNDFLFVAIAAISAGISFFVGLFFFCLSFPIHELGHIIGGHIGSVILNTETPAMVINNTIPCPLFHEIQLPQSVHLEGKATSYFIFGGTISVIFVMYIIALLIYIYIRIPRFRWVIFILPLIFGFSEIVGNTFCGTDRFWNTQIINCNGPIWSVYLITPYLLFLPFFPYFFYGIYSFLKQYFN